MTRFARFGPVRRWLREVRRRLRRARLGVAAALHGQRGVPVQVRPDWRVRVHPDGYEDLRYWLSYEAATLAALAHVWQPGTCIVDIGAHHGSFSVCCLREGGHGIRLLAVEPSPAAWPSLEGNLAVHAGEPCTLHRTALGDRCGTAVFYTGLANMLVGERGLHMATPSKPVAVPVVTLDALCGDQGVTPDILKIDVEGFEDQVLDGATAVLAARPAILLEWHRAMLRRRCVDPMRVVRCLRAAGYQFQLSEDILTGQRHLLSADELPSIDIVRLLCRSF